MNIKSHNKPVALALGAAFITGLSVSPGVHADTNPFAMTALSSGYMVASNKTGEGQCGASKNPGEVNCGAEKAAAKMAKEGECGASKRILEGERGAKKATPPKPIQEAKCGEAKCGANK